MEKLPTEVQQVIMSASTDACSLRSLVFSCSTLYCSFKEADSLIISQVLHNEIGSSVLPEAALTLRSPRCPPKYDKEFQNHFLVPRQLSPQIWKLSEAVRMSKTAFYIRFFATDYIERVRYKWPDDVVFPSQAEIERVERAFYRFEIYCTMFRYGQANYRFDISEQRRLFFSRFSPWENEQLACIHDYLARLVAPAFDDLVEHDVLWGKNSIPPTRDSLDSEYVQAILSYGLSHIYSILKASTYEERHRLIYSPYPPYYNSFLNTGLKAINRDLLTQLHRLTPSEQQEFIPNSFFSDPDAGPEDVWRWSHDTSTPNEFVNCARHKKLREWGYVMWDRLHLDQRDVFRYPWQPMLQSVQGRTAERSAGVDREADLRASQARRSIIHLAGGRGYWDEEDEGKVVWLEGSAASPWDDAKKRRDCVFCLGSVWCAPHRLVLKIKERTE